MSEGEEKKSTWFRLFRPLDADWEIKENLYRGRENHQNYNHKTGQFPVLGHDYSDHTN